MSQITNHAANQTMPKTMFGALSQALSIRRIFRQAAQTAAATGFL